MKGLDNEFQALSRGHGSLVFGLIVSVVDSSFIFIDLDKKTV